MKGFCATALAMVPVFLRRGLARPLHLAFSYDEEVGCIGVRRLIASRMSDAKRNIPHFAYVEEVDVTELESLRQHLNGRLPKGAPSLTYLPFIVKAVVEALKLHPTLNASLDDDEGEIIVKKYYNIGIAVDVSGKDGSRSLMVPNIKNAGALTFALGGLSKSVGLPQLKAAWIAVGGPPGERRALWTALVGFQQRMEHLAAREQSLRHRLADALLGDIRDESTSEIRLVLEPKSRNVDAEILMEQLFRLMMDGLRRRDR